MTVHHIILTVKKELISAFALLDRTFDEDEEFLRFSSSGWSVMQILEHVSLTNHHLLLLIRKGTEKAIRNAEVTEMNEGMLGEYQLTTPGMENIEIPLSFEWKNPDHLAPEGTEPPQQIRVKLRYQLGECLDQLEYLKKGEGVLCSDTMFLNGLGKLDVYQCLYFLALHAHRQVGQIDRLLLEFENKMEIH
jgi:hypothetical protein